MGASVNDRIALSVFSATCLFSESPSGRHQSEQHMARPPDASGCAGSRPSDPCRTKVGDILAVTMINLFPGRLVTRRKRVGPFPGATTVMGYSLAVNHRGKSGHRDQTQRQRRAFSSSTPCLVFRLTGRCPDDSKRCVLFRARFGSGELRSSRLGMLWGFRVYLTNGR